MPNVANFERVFQTLPIYNSYQGFQQALGDAIARVGHAWENWEFRMDGADVIIVNADDPTQIAARFEGPNLSLDAGGWPVGTVGAVTVFSPGTGTVLATGDFGIYGPGGGSGDAAQIVSSVLANPPFYGTPVTNPQYFDALRSGAQDLLILGSDQNDPAVILWGQNDVAFGMGGDDVFWFYSSVNRINGGSGYDSIDFMNRSSRIKVDLSKGTIRVDGQTTKVKSIEEINAGDRADTLTGDPGKREKLYGWGGRDTINGQDRDKLFGGARSDTLDLTGDNGVLKGQGGDDRLTATGNGNRMVGGAGNDTLVSDGNNSMNGGAGNDTLVVNSGQNTIRGGADMDVFVFDTFLMSGTENMQILDYLAGEEIRFGANDTVTMTAQVGNDVVISVDSHDEVGTPVAYTVTVQNTTLADVTIIDL